MKKKDRIEQEFEEEIDLGEGRLAAPASEEREEDKNRRGRREQVTFDILHIDDDLIAVNKPAGLLSVAGRAHEISLRELLREHPKVLATLRPEERDPKFGVNIRSVHRLDRDASGVILFARGLEAQRDLVRQFEQRRVEKAYLAIVTGYVLGEGVIDKPLMIDESAGRSRISEKRGKPSMTEYRVVQRLAGNTLVECRPKTGRLHQIRVHMASIGHPLTVDAVYGGGDAVYLSHHKPNYRPSSKHEERPLIARLTLHAAKLTVEHPRTREPITFEAPLPKDFRATISQLSRLVTGAR
ncbi:MAG: RluA family pseudouridine synthase [Phycisphaerales bacterium]|nr:RluA family pseudouridine synthase [Phycisphaerales bacterium]